jgi:putative tryptophan/tyrosine transport system substrate-binding protein
MLLQLQQGLLMRRRKFIVGIAGAAAWPVLGSAQQREPMRRIGVLMSLEQSEPEGQARINAFLQGLQALGWIEGRNLHIDYRWGGGSVDRIRTYAAELVRLSPEVIVGNATAVVDALHLATNSIPLVFVLANDPIGHGYISSYARPGGNITGFTFLEVSLIGKWLELIKQVVPGTRRAALLFNPELTSYHDEFLRSSEPMQRVAGITLQREPVHNSAELERVIGEVAREPWGSLVLTSDPVIVSNLRFIAKLAEQLKVPAVSIYREYVVEGGLMSYGPDTADIFRRSASYVDRILKGDKPADLPVQAPTIYNFVISLRAAKTLGIEVPPTLLPLADEVIE